MPSFIACNRCWYCDHDLYSLCDTTNPNAELQAPLLGSPTAGIYGYTLENRHFIQNTGHSGRERIPGAGRLPGHAARRRPGSPSCPAPACP